MLPLQVLANGSASDPFAPMVPSATMPAPFSLSPPPPPSAFVSNPFAAAPPPGEDFAAPGFSATGDLGYRGVRGAAG
jgi:hypothetical protein